MTKFRELPGDLVEEILCRVPATSVMRVRSTCKRWERLFNDKRFVRKHSDKSSKQFMCLMVTKRCRICPMSVNLDGDPPSVEVKGELSLLDPRNSALQFDVAEVFHCDGLLLCNSEEQEPRLVVWNPFTGQTRWIETGGVLSRQYSLGYYQDKRSNTRSYKVLSCYSDFSGQDPEIYDFDTDSWRILEGRRARESSDHIVSFKGKTYWFASDEEKPELGVSLLRFDFETEKFGRLPLPYQSRRYHDTWFSVVREEKLAVLLQHNITSKTEVWVTNNIGESESEADKGVSWSKVLALDLTFDVFCFASFLFDEEKNVVMCCNKWLDHENEETYTKDMVYIVGEDNIVTQVEFEAHEFDGCWPAILNYFPSLAQIEPARGRKRKRLDAMDLIEGKPILEAIDIIKNELKTLGRDVEAIGGLAESIPFAMSLLEVKKSELQSLLDAKLSISNRNYLRAVLEPCM